MPVAVRLALACLLCFCMPVPGNTNHIIKRTTISLSTGASRICLIVYAVLFVLSLFLLSFPGDYWPWYMAMVPFAIIPLLLGPRGYRIAGWPMQLPFVHPGFVESAVAQPGSWAERLAELPAC